MNTEHDKFIRMAINMAEKGDTPFGCVIVQGGEVVATGYNSVQSDREVTAHSEIQAIRAATKELGTTNLEDCTLYSNAEPCPMCMAAILWAGIPHVVFGAHSAALAEYVPVLGLSSREVAAASGRSIKVTGGILEDLCLAPFRLRSQKIQEIKKKSPAE